uniref:Putative ixostatin n=1 Tax=Ixodes ricinus TaxID=34613 RepID=A0A0K8RCC9_IXORI
MIRMMILPMSVVLLATSDYIHGASELDKNDEKKSLEKRNRGTKDKQKSPNTTTPCSTGLQSYMKTMCMGLKLEFLERSDCTFTCKGVNSAGQNQTTRLKLMDGLPCGSCKECCDGTCALVHFTSLYPPTLKSCAK